MIKQASYLFAQALPITIILFFLFPRIQGTFGFLPDEDSNLNPSFGDSMKAGDFQQRSTNNGIAFRAEFEQSQNITPEVLYWRVKTISDQQGLKWNQNNKVDKLPKSNIQTTDIQQDNKKETVTYTLTHQATSDTQLPSLEKVVSSNSGEILLNDSIQTTQDFSTTFQYKLTSILPEQNLSTPSISTASYSLDSKILSSYLRTTYAPRKQTRQLLDSWLSQHSLPNTEPDNQFSLESLNSERAKRLAQTALDHFKNQPFKYHLLPPELDQSAPIEDFLFRTQSGYCEHYASTFSTLMRWLGIPSRVVVGYQGGEYNSQGNFYEVRYSNGHAWSEIWTQSDGWIRVDPTFAVAPERIEFGMDALLSLLGNDDTFESGQYNRQKLADVLNPSGSKRFFKSTTQWFSSANHSWDKWVVNYGFEQQRELLKRLGLNTKNQHITLLGILGAALALIFAVILFFIWPRKTKLPPVDAAFQLFKNKLLKQGFHIPLHEGPQDLKDRLSARYTEKQADIHQICQYYIQYKYQNKQIDVAKFMQMVKQFRLNS